MAFQRGKQAAEETAKAECLRRWPELRLRSEARRFGGKVEGYVVFSANRPNVNLGAARSASEAWRECLCKLDDEH